VDGGQGEALRGGGGATASPTLGKAIASRVEALGRAAGRPRVGLHIP
jgi:hypothetical protein